MAEYAFVSEWRVEAPIERVYDLIQTVVDRAERPTRLGGTASGELAGRGDWTLEPDGEATRVRYDWVIRTTRPWMNVIARLPLARRLFEDNHDFVMERGLIGSGAASPRREDGR